MEDEDRLWKLINTSSEVVHTLSKNIYGRALPPSQRRSERANIYFDIPDGVNMPISLFLALYRHLDNVRKVGKVLEKTNQIDRALTRMEQQCQIGDFMENDLMFFQSLQKFYHILVNSQVLLKKRHSIMNRIVAASEPYPVVRPIVDVNEQVLDIVLRERQTYYLIDNSDFKAWKVRDMDGNEKTVASIFFEVDITAAEVQTVSNLQKRLIEFINSLVIRCASMMVKNMEKIQNDHKLLTHFNVEGSKKKELQACISEVKKGLETILSPDYVFDANKAKNFLALVYMFENQLTVVKLHEEHIMDETDDEDTNMYIRLVKIIRFINIIQILINLQRETCEECLRGNKTVQSRASRNSMILQVNDTSTFRSVIEFNFEMVEDVEEDEIRITHPWDDAASETTSVSSSISDFTTTESVVRSTGEIRRRYLIKAVYDSKMNNYVTLADAVHRGIVLYQKGAYVDTTTGLEMPVERAMAEGKIQVEKTTSRKLREDTSSFGIITVKHVITPEKPFLIKTIIHPVSGKHLTLDQATKEGVLDQETSVYRNPLTGVDLQLRSAINRGLVIVEEDETTEHTGEQSTSVSYAVHGVVDKKLRRIVSFAEAAELGLIDRETGAYVDNETGEKIFATEAIKRGFFKGRSITNPESANIEPKNRIVVERFKRLRTKWASVRAFMKMASLHKKLQEQQSVDNSIVVRGQSVSTP